MLRRLSTIAAGTSPRRENREERRKRADAHPPPVTPKYRQNLYHYAGIGLMLLALVGLGVGTRGTTGC